MSHDAKKEKKKEKKKKASELGRGTIISRWIRRSDAHLRIAQQVFRKASRRVTRVNKLSTLGRRPFAPLVRPAGAAIRGNETLLRRAALKWEKNEGRCGEPKLDEAGR